MQRYSYFVMSLAGRALLCLGYMVFLRLEFIYDREAHLLQQYHNAATADRGIVLLMFFKTFLFISRRSYHKARSMLKPQLSISDVTF